mmetsp:Transcript_27139/g.74838  ORF Transcript_27139/g.74838 Transcript_27139/m.74838 type:complete len:86 (-) Transcript_27139:234-491(-)
MELKKSKQKTPLENTARDDEAQPNTGDAGQPHQARPPRSINPHLWMNFVARQAHGTSDNIITKYPLHLLVAFPKRWIEKKRANYY